MPGATLYASGWFRGQPAKLHASTRADGSFTWLIRTEDGRVSYATSGNDGAHAVGWSTGTRDALELEDLELHAQLARTLTSPSPEPQVEMQTTGGLAILTTRPEIALTVGGLSEWRFTIDNLVPEAHDAAPPSDVPGGATWTSASSELTSRIVPATGHLLVQVSVNGVKGWFILDTGAEELVLLPAFAVRALARRIGTVPLASMAGIEESPTVELDVIDVGPLRLTRMAGVVSNALSELPSMIGADVDGIIGFHVFARAVVSLDLAAGRVRIEPQPPSNAIWTPLRFQNRHPILPATYEDRDALFRIDTGAVPGLLFNATTVRRESLLSRATVEVPGTGLLALRVGQVASFSFGGRDFGPQDALFSASEPGAALTDAYTAGIIGIPVLRAFNLVFDYQNRRVAVAVRGNRHVANARNVLSRESNVEEAT